MIEKVEEVTAFGGVIEEEEEVSDRKNKKE
jgi:hypothetical protein